VPSSAEGTIPFARSTVTVPAVRKLRRAPQGTFRFSSFVYLGRCLHPPASEDFIRIVFTVVMPHAVFSSGRLTAHPVMMVMMMVMMFVTVMIILVIIVIVFILVFIFVMIIMIFIVMMVMVMMMAFLFLLCENFLEHLFLQVIVSFDCIKDNFPIQLGKGCCDDGCLAVVLAEQLHGLVDLLFAGFIRSSRVRRMVPAFSI
jgi:hypothetical protein